MIVAISVLYFLGFVSSQTGFAVHSRYIIPILPLLYILASKSAYTINRSNIFTVSISVIIIWMVFSNMYRYPCSISYFNELAGSPDNWHRCLSGSNIDWGQDLYKLKDWITKNPDAKPLYTFNTSRKIRNNERWKYPIRANKWLDSYRSKRLV
jgi:hypothetical protein